MLGSMYLILIAWLYVTLMMAIAEATNPIGSVLGGIVTFVLYGLLPMSIVAYLLATPQRKRRLKARRQAEQQAWDAAHQTTLPKPPTEQNRCSEIAKNADAIPVSANVDWAVQPQNVDESPRTPPPSP